ncbi:MAG: hypothetical protein D6806_00375 [Deltaproteobacteria bacterium]|nr:MAG: hypothetical protein D6806_00375 [Deltaproteobacteria bacterium]
MIWPLVFWFLGCCMMACALLVVSSPRPHRALQALVALMGINSIELVLAGAPLLAVELAVVVCAAVLAVWVFVIRGRKAKLGVPGRVRFGIAKIVAGCVVLVLVLELLARPMGAGSAVAHAEYELGPAGALVSGMVLVSSLVSAICVFRGGTGSEEEKGK